MNQKQARHLTGSLSSKKLSAMQIHENPFWKLLLLLVVAIFLIPPSPVQAQQTDIQLLKVTLSKETIIPGETFDLNYWLRSEGPLNTGFNMKIFIAKGGNGKWVKEWKVPSKQLDKLRNGDIVSQKRSIEVPNWGDGEYRISICTDVENRLGDVNRENNIIEKKIMVDNVVTVRPLIPVKPVFKERAKNRMLKPDGSVEIRFADGSGRILHPDGNISSIQKDGSTMKTYSIQVTTADLPPLPGQIDAWGETVQDNLLKIIEEQLDDDEMDSYMMSEAGKKYYDIVLWRIKFISFILSEKQETGH